MWVRSYRLPWIGGQISSSAGSLSGRIVEIVISEGSLNVYSDRYAFASGEDATAWGAHRKSRRHAGIGGVFRTTTQFSGLQSRNSLPSSLDQLGFARFTVVSPREMEYAGRIIYPSATHDYVRIPLWFVCLVLVPPSIPAFRRFMRTVFSARCPRCCGVVKRSAKCMTCGAPAEGRGSGLRSRLAFSGCLLLGLAIFAVWAWSWVEVDMFQRGWRSDWAARVVRMDLAQGDVFFSFRNYSAGIHDAFANTTLSDLAQMPFFYSMPDVAGFHRMPSFAGFGFVQMGWEVANHTEFHVNETKVQMPLLFLALAAVAYPARKILKAWNWRRIYGVIPDGTCTRCGYDLTGNTSGVCPECGKTVAAKKPASVGVAKDSPAPSVHP